MQQTRKSENFYALLVGINHYLPNLLPNGLYYKSLLGCVQDVTRVETFLKRDLRVPSENIMRLTSSTPITGTTPPEPQAQWPTYENIVNAFKALTDVASPGDQIFIHYSGHGGRALTSDDFKDIKGKNGIDEVLVPMDLGDSEGRYLRDTEINFLVQAMVEKGLYVTLVLDSCHAGGATRSFVPPNLGGAGVRGAGVIDTFERSTKSLVASPEELRRVWQPRTQPGIRDASVNSGWLLEPKGYVLLAACQANEYANEIVFEGNEKNGALSYWLVDSLKHVGPDFTYAMLHARVFAKVHGQFAAQSPQLQGEGQRVVFDVGERLLPQSVPVTRVDGGTVSINAGLAHGVTQGSQFSIYATNESDFSNTQKRIAVVEVTEVGPVTSQSRIIDHLTGITIEAGNQAVLLQGGKIRLRGGVRVLSGTGPSVEPLQTIQTRLETDTGFAFLAKDDEIPDYLLTTKEEEFVICDAAGNEIPNLRPPVKISNNNATGAVIDRLNHLVKYTNVRELDNNDSISKISEKLVVDLVSRPPDFKPGLPVRPQPLTSLGSVINTADGDWAFLRIRNNYEPHVLNITVLDLQSDWGIAQIYPARAGNYETLDPGRELILPLQVTLPKGYESGTDIVKVFATIEPTSFRSLELPSLDQSEATEQATHHLTRNPLEKFLATFESPLSARSVAVDVCASMEWAAHQVEIEISQQEVTVSREAHHA
jgi:hypothetical protein